MTWLPDSTLAHLKRVADWPELSDGKYRLVEELARGGMGTVYIAEDSELSRQVALKVLSDPLSDPDAAERMVREAQIIARLEHPGIVPVHDVGRLADGRIYYVMKLVRGDRLDRHFAPGADLGERLRVFERICEAVSFAHAHGVIHRDLKPANVMVGPFGEVLVLDWGVAKLVGDVAPEPAESSVARETLDTLDTDPANAPTLTQHTAHGTVIGTPAYMAPEQARGEIESVDERSDVYALGAILYFLLTRRDPPEADTARSGAPGDPLEPPRKVDPTISRALQAICLKALEDAPVERYARVEELGADIARFQSGQAVLAYPEGPFEKAARFANNYRTPILLVLAYLVMRLALLLFS